MSLTHRFLDIAMERLHSGFSARADVSVQRLDADPASAFVRVEVWPVTATVYSKGWATVYVNEASPVRLEASDKDDNSLVRSWLDKCFEEYGLPSVESRFEAALAQPSLEVA